MTEASNSPTARNDELLSAEVADCARRLRDGDCSAGNELARLLDRPLKVKLRQKVSEERFNDVYQETWARFFRQVLDGAEPDNYVAWFLGISRLVSLELSRKDSRTAPLEDWIAEIISATDPDLDRATYAAQIHARLVECLDTIPSRYRDFLIGYVKNEDRRSLCNRVNLAFENYSKFLHRARIRLSSCIGEKHEIGESI